MKLREYQTKMIDSIVKNIVVGNKRILVYGPTGCGKTIISKSICERIAKKGKSVMFTVPRRKLAIQTQEKFGRGNILMGADSIDNGDSITIASINTLHSRKHKKHYDYIILDEVHHAHDSEYINYIMKTWKDSIVIGLSATPVDQKGYLLEGWDCIVKEVTMRQLVDEKFLVDFEIYSTLLHPDTTKVQERDGDYNMEQTGELASSQLILSGLVNKWEELAKRKKTLVFACNIKHAEIVRDSFREYNYTAECVHSKMDEKEIQKIYKWFSNGNIEILINVDMATFGYDEPSIECLLFARPTKSMRLYKQMVGRGSRSHPGKTHCIMIDGGNVIAECGMPLDEIEFIRKPVVSKKVDHLAGITQSSENTVERADLPAEKQAYLKKISKLIDLYADKEYIREKDLQADVKTFLKKTQLFHWRQNSGVLYQDGRYIHFTDRKGLPDIACFYKGIYVGIELKLPCGRLTEAQAETLPEMIDRGLVVFFAQTVVDVFEIIEHLEKNIYEEDGKTVILDGLLNDIPETQKAYRRRHKI